MTIKKKLTAAQQSRLDYRKIRFATPLMEAEPPEIHPDNPLLPEKDDDAGNQVPLALQGLELKVQIPRPPRADDRPPVGGFIDLVWDGSRLLSTRHTYLTPIPADVLMIDIALPEGLTDKEGRHTLSYHLEQGGNIGQVIPVDIYVDRTAPLPVVPVIVPEEVERDGITKKYLDDKGYVPINVPEYAGRKLDDVIECFIGRSLLLPTPIGKVERTDFTIPLDFKLTAAMLDDEEGVRGIFYIITDRKGNKSGHSPEKRLNVTLTDPPEDLLPPDIPLYSDNEIDLEDAQMGVGVGFKSEVPYTNYLEGDQLAVTWDGKLQAAVTIPGFPFHVTIPFRDVYNNNPDKKTVTVSYQVKRKNVLHPLVPLKRDDIVVDLRKPGAPVDPEKPGNPNPDLPVVTVQGAANGTPDQLTDADDTGPVTVTAALYPSPKDGDVVQLYWKGEPVSEDDGGVIRIGAAPPTDLTFRVSWSVIDTTGNGNPIRAHYDISHTLNGNKDVAPHKDVIVLIRPGVVPEVKFQHLSPDYADFLNCPSLRNDPVSGITVVEVRVAGGEVQLEDQELTFVYQGWTDDAGTIAKADTRAEVTYKPTAQEASAGFIVRIPYDPAIKNTENAWGDVTYTAVIDGHPTPSARHLVRVYMTDSSNPGGTCPLL